jgi:hypothetical protein
MKSRFYDIVPDGELAVKIFSTAYNSGYRQSFDDLQKRSFLRGFPDGKMGPHIHFSYSEIAVDYFRQSRLPQ